MLTGTLDIQILYLVRFGVLNSNHTQKAPFESAGTTGCDEINLALPKMLGATCVDNTMRGSSRLRFLQQNQRNSKF